MRHVMSNQQESAIENSTKTIIRYRSNLIRGCWSYYIFIGMVRQCSQRGNNFSHQNSSMVRGWNSVMMCHSTSQKHMKVYVCIHECTETYSHTACCRTDRQENLWLNMANAFWGRKHIFSLWRRSTKKSCCWHLYYHIMI